MKEFVVYTVLRIVLFLAAFGVVVGVMALLSDGTYDLFWAVVLAFLLRKWGASQLQPAWFIVLSLLGSLAFALPVALLWRRSRY